MDDRDLKLANWIQRWLRDEVGEDEVVEQLGQAAAVHSRQRPERYADVFAAAAAKVDRLRRHIYISIELARERADQLIAIDPSEVVEKLEAQRETLTPAVTDALLGRAREIVTSDPEEALRRADLALRASWIFYLDHRQELGSTAVLHDLRARCAAHQGNALRLRCAYAQGERRFQRALAAVEQGSGDPLVGGEVCHLYGSMLRDRRHFAEARAALRRSAQLYRIAGQSHDEGKVSISQALTEREAGEPSSAATFQHRAIALLDFEAEPWWKAAAYTNLALFLAESGDAEAGRRTLDEHPLEREADPRAKLHRRWIEGVVDTAVGDTSSALKHLEAAREAFAEAGDGHRFAMASIDLAAVHGARGDWTAMRELAAQSLAVLHGLDVPRDAVAAFLVFERATKAEILTSEVLRGLRRGLEEPKLWRCPEQPS